MVRSFGVGVASGPPETHKKIETDGPEHNICIGEQASVSGQLLEPDGTTAHHEQGVLVTFNGVSIANPTDQTDPDGYASLTYTPAVGNKTVRAAAPDYQAYHEPSRFAVVEVQSLAPDEGTQVDTIQTGPDNVSTDVWIVPWEPGDDPSAPGPFVNVPATPNPDVSLADLPPGWSLREGEYGDPIPRADQNGDGVDDNTGETKKLAKVDKSAPGSTLVIADAGTSHKRALVKVAKVNLTADLHGDGGVNHGTPEPEDEQQEASEGGDVYISATAPAADSPDTEAIMRLWETWAPTDPNATIALAVDDPTIVQLWSLHADNTWHKESTPLTWAGDDGPPGELYVEGLKKGTTNLTLKYKYNGHTTGVKDKVKINVADIKVTWKAHNSPLDTNPNKGGGKRIFPGKQDPDDSAPKNKVQVKATVHNAGNNATVHFQAFDVDDPSADNNVVDPDPNPDDNRGDGQNAGGVFLKDTDNDGQLEPVGTSIDVDVSNGAATATFRVSMQPGDNYRVVGALNSNFLTGLHPKQSDKYSRVLDANNQPVSKSHTTKTLTVWRKLHVELDSMARPTFPENYLQSTIDGVSTTSSGATELISSQSLDDGSQNLDDSPAGNGRFENGTLQINGNTVHVLDVEANGNHRIRCAAMHPLSGLDFHAYDNDWLGPDTIDGTITKVEKVGVSYVWTLHITAHSQTPIDWLDFPGGGKLTVANGDEMAINGANGAAKTLSTTTVDIPFDVHDDDTGTILPKQPDTSDLKSRYSQVYIKPVLDDEGGTSGSDQNNISFLLEGGVFDKWQSRDNNTHFFWVVYILNAFQHGYTTDFDPDTEGGWWAGTGTVHGGTLLFLESQRDGKLGGWTSRVTVHELGHAFGLGDRYRSASRDGIMYGIAGPGAGSPATNYSFIPLGAAALRSASQPGS